jgi:hypothetical protein
VDYLGLLLLAIAVAGLLATICFGLCLLLLKLVDKPYESQEQTRRRVQFGRYISSKR